MRKPTDAAIRKAVIEYTVANARWAELALSDLGTETYRRLVGVAPQRHWEMVTANAALIALGMQLIHSEGKK